MLLCFHSDSHRDQEQTRAVFGSFEEKFQGNNWAKNQKLNKDFTKKSVEFGQSHCLWLPRTCPAQGLSVKRTSEANIQLMPCWSDWGPGAEWHHLEKGIPFVKPTELCSVFQAGAPGAASAFTQQAAFFKIAQSTIWATGPELNNWEVNGEDKILNLHESLL